MRSHAGFDEVYAITKAMITGYDAYKDSAPGAGGLAADRQTKNWVVPVHPGAVKALKEAGQWTDEQEAHNKESAQAPGGAGRGMGGLTAKPTRRRTTRPFSKAG